MAKNRFISTIVVIVAMIFIGYVLMDSLDSKTDSASQPQQLNEETLKESGSSETLYNRIDEVGLNRGMIAPDFTLQLWGTDEKVALSSFQGQIVVLNLWATWCPPCRDEMPDLNQFYNDYKDKGVTVLGINMLMTEASLAVVDDFMEEYQITFPNVIDERISVTNQRGLVQTQLYNAITIPKTYIIDQKGHIFVAHTGIISYELIEDLVEKVKKVQ
ncbi:TlpA disulfide reductase family protein [Bacillaceae bacterium IKA-2]|nr:TlpA disulfide reductase family protein [Bacillaceae bacterium IKA-2]